jgi:putative flippase GtrA
MSETATRALGRHLKLTKQLLIFGFVGAAAFATHFGVVSVIVPFGIHPLLANVVAFLTAFGVSFVGHNTWTFPAAGSRDKSRALRRFAVVACSSFALNEMLYALLLGFTPLSYRIALLIVLVVVASVTLVLSKYWAFADGRT